MATTDKLDATSKPTASERAAAKRRQVRKGTRSCWECRRRKIRCLFDETGPRDTCRRCWQKGTPCVSQEFPEEHLPHTQATAGNVGDRLGRMERLVEQLYRTNSTESAGQDAQPDQDERATSTIRLSLGSPQTVVAHHEDNAQDQSQNSPFLEASSPQHASQTKPPEPIAVGDATHNQNDSSTGPRLPANAHLAALNRKLAAALPSAEDCKIINELYSDADLVFQFMLAPQGTLEKLVPETVEQFVASLYRPMHPVALAKKMLTLATMLQRIPSTYSRRPSTSASPCRIMERLAEAPTSLVCEDNKLMGSIDALQCIILQAVYLANGGNLRLSLLAIRRALSMAQLMGIHRPHDSSIIETVDPTGPPDTRFIWFRIVYLERFVCLLLGLPDSTRDHYSSLSMEGVSPTLLDDHPHVRLEQVHCAVASRIIQRNQQDSFSVMLEATGPLDLEMQAAAAAMPPRWWTIPRFNGDPDKPLSVVLESLRLCGQIFHYFLLIQLHLPFMLRHSRDGTASNSRMACIDASREVLSRFVAIRSAKGVCSIPDAADFFALIAGMTLLLAHIDARRRDRGNDVLAHQRHTDRDKVEETLELMRDGSSVSTDVLSMKSADVLRNLLSIESYATNGSTFTSSWTPSTASTPVTGNVGPHDEASNLQLRIPYYGTVIISPDAPPLREPFRSVGQQALRQPEAFGYHASTSMALDRRDPAAMDVAAEQNFPLTSGRYLMMDSVNDRSLLADDQVLGPGFSARVEDWTFQGVDAAFFDCMIRGFEESDSCDHSLS